MKNKFTIIIPEHNRPDHLKRLLDYFLFYNLNIIVVDSSNVKFKYIEEFHDRIIYRFYPKMNLASKISRIISLVESPYVVMCANDDFLVPRSIEKIIEFLDKNLDYNSGQGIYLGFSYDKNGVFFSQRYHKTSDIDLNSNTPSRRLYDLQSNYFQYYYAVFRTHVFRDCYNSVINNNSALIQNLCLLESYISSYTVIEGKHIILPIVYSVRENILNSASSFTDNMFEVVTLRKSEIEYSNYVGLLANHLAKNENINLNSARILIVESVDIYLHKFFSHYFGLFGRTRYVARKIILKMFSRRIISKLISNKKKSLTPIPLSFSKDETKDLQLIKEYIYKYDYIYKGK